jgi:raffinose/stachyose/melibiose transport system permease protein
MTVAVVITGIATLRNFDVIYNLTQGGPGFSTVVPAYEVYYRAFVEGSVGSACALAMVLAAFIFVFAFIATRVLEFRT